MVTVTKSNFVELSNDFLLHLPTADFVAIDEEMTGINLPNTGRPRKEQSPTERYGQNKLVPETYTIIQLGISLHYFKSNQVRQYTFYMFPNANHSRNVTLSPSAIHFLNQHGMSFDVWTKQGIPYCTESQANEAIQAYLNEECQLAATTTSRMSSDGAGSGPTTQAQPTVQETLTRRVELRRTEDIEFFARTMASLREWLDAATPPSTNHREEVVDHTTVNYTDGRQFLLPACNSFLRRALCENISKEYPNLILEKVEQSEHNLGNNNINPNHQPIRVLRLSPEEFQTHQHRLRYQRWSKFLTEKMGVWRIVAALKQVCHGMPLDRTHPLFAASPDHIQWDAVHPASTTSTMKPPPNATGRRFMPLVVHNGFMDLLFLMTHFHAPKLPNTLTECKALIQSYFPLIFDTKVLSIEYCGYAEMNLATLYQVIGDKNLRVISTGGGHDGVSTNDAQGSDHEAAYDAYMTGAIFVGLSQHLRPSETQHQPVVEESDEEGEVEEGEGTLPQRRRFLPTPWFESKLGKNRIYHLGLFTLDLENLDHDPLSKGLLPEASFWVTGIDPSVTTRDIVWCLHELVDSERRPVNFDIVWVDDTTFVVACRYRPNHTATLGLLASADDSDGVDVDESILRQHGQLIHRALTVRFGKDGIRTLEEHFQQMRAADNAKRRADWISRFLDYTYMGSLKRKLLGSDSNTDNDQQRGVKRQRRN